MKRHPQRRGVPTARLPRTLSAAAGLTAIYLVPPLPRPPRRRGLPTARLPRTLSAAAGLTAIYFVLTVLGLQWATLNGAASPVFPAAGVALAGLVLGGIRLW